MTSRLSPSPTVDPSLLSVGNHDLGFLASREHLLRGASIEQFPHLTQLWGVQSSIGEPCVKSEVSMMLLRAILLKPGISDQDLARQFPVIPSSDIRDVSPPRAVGYPAVDTVRSF